ncbi:phasin family protein [Microvirga alba]|uniref:Phasin family protein n=1 Tax=Microvirga alba TaxID=2791025 RepID=A0A931BW77_9HYPH|nr:phasin family protein [Microvirga alba]MBF9234985.1 phasin family protein [Microvirga alba]
MADAKKAGAKTSTKSVQKSKTVPKPPVTVEKTETVIAAEAVGQPPVAPIEAVQPSSTPQDTSDALRQSVSEAARGALEVNDKILDALQAQSDAALDLWRSTLRAHHFSDAILAQTSSTREAYENASAHWKDIAETTARWFHKSLEPLQSALHRQDR